MNFTGFENIDRTYFKVDGTAFAGISGGRTSGLMAALLDSNVQLLFENTGREKEETYIFVEELSQSLGRRITWLEYRKPPNKGDAPKYAGVAVVDFATANRKGQPFIDFMETLAEYRALVKNQPPVAPWARSRICTAQMKHKTAERWIAAQGVSTYTMFVGLRADEKGRVDDLMKAETSKRSFLCPLYDAGISETDVRRFWSQQSFDLQLESFEGNCDGCFLKDQADLSRMLGRMQDPEFWFRMEEAYKWFGGRDFVGYRRLHDEYTMRMNIEKLLRAGVEPQPELLPASVTPKRFLNVIRQERKRIEAGPGSISCNCERSFNMPEEG